MPEELLAVKEAVDHLLLGVPNLEEGIEIGRAHV